MWGLLLQLLLRVIFMDNIDNTDLKIPPMNLIEEELAREEARYSFRKTLWNITAVLIVVAAVAALMATRLFVLIRINGGSMSPTLVDGEIVFLHQTKDIEPGDIVGFYYGGRILLKRAVAGAGDEVEIDREGNVYVNGSMLKEPYLQSKSLGKCELDFPYVVPEGMTFVLGDNRAISIDSRNKKIGCVEKGQFVGKVVFRAWPLGRAGIMR